MKQDKKKLYESIMASVAKEVKKALNEAANDKIILKPAQKRNIAEAVNDFMIDLCQYDDDPKPSYNKMDVFFNDVCDFETTFNDLYVSLEETFGDKLVNLTGEPISKNQLKELFESDLYTYLQRYLHWW